MTDAPLLGRHDAVPRRRWRWLLPVFVVLAVGGLLGSLAVRAHDKNEASPEHAVNAYLEAVETGATTRAYGMLCDDFRRQKSLKEFERTIAEERTAAGGVVGHHLARIEVRGDKRLATYTVRRQESDIVIDAALVHESGHWKLCGFKTRDRREPAQLGPAPGFGDTGVTTTTR